MSDREMRIMEAWYRLVELDRRLRELEELVEILACHHSHPEHDRRYVQWKRALSKLVGWDSNRTTLQSAEAFTAAHSYLLLVFERGTDRG